MTSTDSTSFLAHLNANMGIAHKVSRLYFEDAETREELVQEMMFRLWKAFPNFDQRAKFSTWMYRVCLNTALTYFKNSKQRKTVTLEEQHFHLAEEPPSDQEEQWLELMKAISELPSINKAIILLYLEDHSYAEISDIIGISISNVSVKLVRIKKELEKNLKKN